MHHGYVENVVDMRWISVGDAVDIHRTYRRHALDMHEKGVSDAADMC